MKEKGMFVRLFEKEGLEGFSGKSFACSCGRTHTIGTKVIRLGRGVAKEAVKCGLSGTPLIVADQNTLAYLPDQWKAEKLVVFGPDPLEADAGTVGRVFFEIAVERPDYLIALGSGNIGDIVRYSASAANLPFINVTTAPSMDGAASRHSPLIRNGRKTTYPAREPYGILFDLDILEKAPQPMIAAGLADIEGKHTAALDWLLGHICTGEDYCAEIQELALEAVCLAEKSAEGLRPGLSLADEKRREAMKHLSEALLLSSLAMQLNVTSRPASGTEHLLSHAWENYGIARGESPMLHGDKVGVATLLVIDMYERFFRKDKSCKEAVMKRAREESEKNPAFRKAEGQSISYRALLDRWEELEQKTAEVAGRKEAIQETIRLAGGPVLPEELGIDEEKLRYGYEHATDGRPRVTLAHLYRDLGIAL